MTGERPGRMLVTGASGFVGGAVARAAVADGWEVVTTSRRTAAVPGARHVAWDLTRPAPAEVLGLGRLDVVVHCASYVGESGPRAQVRAATVDGTRAVLAAAPGVRVVHMSSASVYDPSVPSVRVREDAAPVSQYLNPYAEAKADAERVVLAEARASGREVVVLRPHAVYGPGDTTLLPRVLGAVRGDRLLLPGGGDVLQALTAVGTLVEASLRAAVVGLDGPLVANVTDAEAVVLRDALTELLDRRGLAVRVVPVPARAAWLVAGIGEALGAVSGGRVVPRLSRYALSHLLHERTYDLTVATDRLGVRPGPTSFEGASAW